MQIRNQNVTSEDTKELFFYQVEVFIIRGLCKSAWKHFESERWPLKDSNYFERWIEKSENIKGVLHYGKDFEIEVYLKIFKLEVDDIVIESYDSTTDKKDVLTHVAKLCSDDKYTDISICYKNIELMCHKPILAARSEFFARMFKDNPKVDRFEFEATDYMNKATFAECLHFVYTGQTEFKSLENALHLMAMGNTLGIPDLKEIYENVLKVHTTSKNATDMLYFAIKFNSCHGLKEQAFKYIKKLVYFNF